jgi:hypothetical protein
MSATSSVDSLVRLPGMTRCSAVPCADMVPSTKLDSLPPSLGRPIVLLATANISNDNIFNNGLYQNVYFIYKLFESIGWLPILTVQEKPSTLEKVPLILQPCRFMLIDELLKQPVKIALYIEIGMSVEPRVRAYMHALGAKVVKLYLGNILNIDIETPMFTPSINFSHHVVGEMDEIWTSPHYGQHAAYAAVLNRLPADTCRIAPYVWDSTVLTNGGLKNPTWRPRAAGEKLTFVIMEPNISIQKNGLIPLLIAEKFHNTFPQEDTQVVLMNGDRLRLSPHFERNILPYLTLFKEGRIQFEGRRNMAYVQENYPYAIPIVHHINNEFNYMTLEYLYAGFPVLHNCDTWSAFGYYYPENDITKGVVQGLYAHRQHADSLETYKSHAKILMWRHSPYNPTVQEEWKKLVAAVSTAHEKLETDKLKATKKKS